MMIMVAAPFGCPQRQEYHHLTYGMAGSRRWGLRELGFDMGSPLFTHSGRLRHGRLSPKYL